jgi:predicted nucleotidyltransferase
LEELSIDENPSVRIYLPQPFTFLLMKLHAFADRVNDTDRQYGSHHALDTYRIVAMLTKDEFKVARASFALNANSAPVQGAKQIIGRYFSNERQLGILRMKEHPLFDENFQVDAVISALGELVGLTETL